MDGVQRDGLSLPDVPVCEILELPCEEGGHPLDLKEINDLNVRVSGKDRLKDADMSEILSNDITKILKRMDCKYEHLRNDDGIRILHESNMFLNCSQIKPISNVEACGLIHNRLGCHNWKKSSNSSLQLNEEVFYPNNTNDISLEQKYIHPNLNQQPWQKIDITIPYSILSTSMVVGCVYLLKRWKIRKIVTGWMEYHTMK